MERVLNKMNEYHVNINTKETTLSFISRQSFVKVDDLVNKLLKDTDVLEVKVYIRQSVFDSSLKLCKVYNKTKEQ